jgi:hypothetical protein
MNNVGYTLFFDNPASAIATLCVKVGETPTTGLRFQADKTSQVLGIYIRYLSIYN